MHLVDIVLHGVVAAGAVAIVGVTGLHWLAAFAASTGFLIREELQAVEKYAAWLLPWQWSHQKLAEGLVPVAAAIVVALLWHYGQQPRTAAVPPGAPGARL